MDRQEGYYWIKYRTGYQIAYWGEWLTGCMSWFCVGNEEQYEDSDFEHINENRILQPGEIPE